MSNSTNLNLPFILPAQAQKHVTHNEALKMLDALVQLSVVDNSLSAPPLSPSEGERYAIASAPTGDWETKENQIAIWHDGAWSFYPPNKGWITWVESSNSLQVYNGTHWVDISGVLAASTASIFGINAAADTTNRLSVNSAAILFNKEVDDVQVKLNKQASTDNASFLFQTNFSGRAEMGTTGNDDFHFKVSSDGATWNDGILINKSTGEVSFPNTTLSGGNTEDTLNDLVSRIFARISPTQWGFCHVALEAYTDLAKTTKAVATDDVVAVIADKSPNDIDLVAGGSLAATKIKFRSSPATVGVDGFGLSTHYLKVTVPTGGFKGTIIMAYRSGCIVSQVDVPAGEWQIWSGHGIGVASGFIGALASENISQYEIEAVVNAFHQLGAGSKSITTCTQWYEHSDDYYQIPNFNYFDFSNINNFSNLLKGGSFSKIRIGAINTTNASNFSRVFSGCSSLILLDVPDWDMSNVTDFTSMFNGCSSLTTLDASCWNTSSATNLSYLFYNCSALTTLDISHWETAAVTDMSYMFHGCSSIVELDISGWDLANVANMHRTFRNCHALTSIKVGGAFDNIPCVNFAYAFSNTSLDQLSVDDVLVSIEKAGTSNGTLHIAGGNISAPSSIGTTAKAALQGRGWTVATN